MRRRQLFEVEDQPWCPQAVRDGATDLLRTGQERGRVFAPIVPLLAQALRASKATRIVDLCAGGGGPWRTLLPLLEAEGGPAPEVVLTDLFPNRAAFRHAVAAQPARVRAVETPVDATRVPEALVGFRTLFNAFHHFAPDKARALLEDAVRKREGIALFEMSGRSAVALLGMPLVPVLALGLTPFVRPVSAARLALTYLLPVIPAVALVDGYLSCFRAYAPEELRALTEGLDPSYHFEVGEVSSLAGLPLTYLIGQPPQRE